VSGAGFAAAIRDRVTEAIRIWAPGARGAWCRNQRRRLRSSNGAVIWVRGPALPWAEWGARRGYFAVGYMDEIAYLQALPGPGADACAIAGTASTERQDE
jgi:hypothetical protein